MPENKDFDLNLLRVFDTIYRLGTITKAAEKLNVSQPAISHSLARLRDLYDDKLFNRSPNGMTPTPVATDIALNISEALQQTRISLAKAGLFDPISSNRHFKFEMQDASSAIVLPTLMPMIQNEAPDMTIQVFQDHRQDALEALVTGAADFVIDNFVPAHPKVMQIKFATEKYVCAVRADHPVIKDKITLEQYMEHGHIHASGRKAGKSYVDLALQSQGLQRKIVFQTQHYLETPLVLADTDLILTTTASIAKAHNLKTFPLPFDVAPINVSLFWHASQDSDPASCWMRNRIIELFSEG
jgi:DNA-binding transcriptional LysR family regulator